MEGQDDQSDGIPVRAEILVPGDGGAENAERLPDEAAEQRVEHGFRRGEARGDVAADDTIDDAIERGEELGTVGGIFTERREGAQFMEEGVGDDGKKYNKDEACAQWPGRCGRDCGVERAVQIAFPSWKPLEGAEGEILWPVS
jgi:hypothetical protein